MVETRFQTSFIPKKPTQSGVAYRGESRSLGLLGGISLSLTIIAGLTSGALFLYTQFLESNIVRLDEELTQERNELDESALSTFKSLGKRVKSANELVDKHIVFSNIASFFETSVLKNVRISDFNFETKPGNRTKISIKGEAQSYAAVASQDHAFKDVSYVVSSSFSNLTLDDKGNVTFSAILELEKSVYDDNLGGGISFVGTIN